MMKTSFAFVFALLLAGCGTSRQESSLTAEDAMTLAVQLANAKSYTLFQKLPFRSGKLPQFAGGRWVWTDIRGVGRSDIEAQVELAADGSTNSVEVHMLVNQAIQIRGIPVRP